MQYQTRRDETLCHQALQNCLKDRCAVRRHTRETGSSPLRPMERRPPPSLLRCSAFRVPDQASRSITTIIEEEEVYVSNDMEPKPIKSNNRTLSSLEDTVTTT